MSTFNPFDAEDRMRAQYGAALSAVAKHFSWLDVTTIENPPHQYFDAYLARQIAVHITCEFFGVPRRRLSDLTERARARVSEAVGTVEARRGDTVFETAYRAMCGDAQSLFSKLMEASTDG